MKNWFFQSIGTEFYNNPFWEYQKMQKSDIFYDDFLKSWIVTRYNDIIEWLNNKNLTSNRWNSYFWQLSEEEQNHLVELKEFLSKWLLFSDWDYHKKLKTELIRSSFFKNINQFRYDLEEKARKSLNEHNSHREKFDLLNDYALPLSTEVISKIFWIPQKDFYEIMDWSNDFIIFISRGYADFELWKQTLESYYKFKNYVESLIDSRDELEFWKNLLDDLLKLHKDWNITKDELLATIWNILIDWYEPSALSICQWLRLITDNNINIWELQQSKKWLHEIFRLEPIFMCAARRAENSTYINNTLIEINERVLFILWAWNYDNSVFINPYSFDINRYNSQNNLSFWYWHHKCIGMWLAHTIVDIWIKEFLRFFDNKNILIENPTYRESIWMRWFDKLICKIW